MGYIMKVVGITRGKTKEKKKPFTVLHLIGDFDDYQIENSEGNTAQNVYVAGDQDVEVGDEIELVYGVGFEGKAVVKGINVLLK
jgi:hypothetical protein